MPLNLTNPDFQVPQIQSGGVIGQLPSTAGNSDLSSLGSLVGGLVNHITKNPVVQNTPTTPNQSTLAQYGVNAMNGQSGSGNPLISTAQSMMGMNENTDNSALRAFFQKSGEGQLDPSKTPWCAGFANAVLQSNHIAGTNSLSATSFLGWGNPTKTPQKGDVAVVDYHNGHGHVGFFDGYDSNGNVQILGGNSGGGKVGISVFSPNRIAGFRTAPTAGELQQKGLPQPGAGTAVPQNPILDRTMSAISRIETGDSKNPYSEITNAGNGRQAIGKYQILNSNIPSWTKAATGKAYTPAEFKTNSQLQDTTARYMMNQMLKQYGNANDVASVWFSGKPANQSQDLKDNLGTTGSQYVNQFQKYYNDNQNQKNEITAPTSGPRWDILGSRG